MSHGNEPNPQASPAQAAHPTPPASRTLGLTLIVLVVVATVVLASWGILSRRAHDRALVRDTTDQAAPTVTIAAPKAGSPVASFLLPGNTAALTDSPIFARTSGYLAMWYFDIGTRVKKGDLLAEFASPEVDQQIHQAEADLAQAQASRYTSLVTSQAVSKQDTDTYVNLAVSTQAQVRSAQANLDRIRQLQAFEKIYAPFDGVVTARTVDTGQLIDAGANKELFHLQAIQTLRVYTNLPQIYSSAVRRGAKIDVTFPEHAGKT